MGWIMEANQATAINIKSRVIRKKTTQAKDIIISRSIKNHLLILKEMQEPKTLEIQVIQSNNNRSTRNTMITTTTMTHTTNTSLYPRITLNQLVPMLQGLQEQIIIHKNISPPNKHTVMTTIIKNNKEVSNKSIDKTGSILSSTTLLTLRSVEWVVVESLILKVLQFTKRTAKKFSKRKENNLMHKHIVLLMDNKVSL